MARENGIDVTRPVELPQRETRTQSKREVVPPVQTSQGEEKVSEGMDTKWGNYLAIPALSDVASTKREGLETNYRFETRLGAVKREEYLKLRSGALTLICGKSSHCKSKFLQNLSLQIAEKERSTGGNGVVLFFHYEEETSDVLSQFANIYTDKEISQYGTANTEIILDYFKTGSLDRCPGNKRQEVLQKLKEFESLYSSGGLRVFYSDLYSEDLCELINYLSNKVPVKAVFIDYIQAIQRDPKKKMDTRESLREVSKDLCKVAIDLSIPVVLSAQLNRKTPNPVDMSEDNIAESADITRYANTIVCLWNSAFDNVDGGKESFLNTEEGRKLQERGFNLGEGGKIYAKITKHRGGTPYLDTILNYRGETGKIYTNEDLPLDSYQEEDRTFKEW